MSSQLSPFAQPPVRPETGWNALLERAAVEVMEFMVGIHPEPCEPSPEDSSPDTMAMVGLAGALCGMMTICCSRETAQMIASHMLGGGPVANENAASDALGEVCNMVAGNFKARVPSLADDCVLSVPTVVSGDSYTLRAVDAEDRLDVLLAVDGARLWISLMIQS